MRLLIALVLSLLTLASCAHQPKVQDLCDIAVQVCQAVEPPPHPRCAPNDQSCQEL